MRLWVRKRWSSRSIAADYSMPRPFGKPCAAANCHPERSRRISQRTADYPKRRSRSRIVLPLVVVLVLETAANRGRGGERGRARKSSQNATILAYTSPERRSRSQRFNHGFETRSAPASLAATPRSFAFYLGNPISSIETHSLPALARSPQRPFPSVSLFPELGSLIPQLPGPDGS